jgi:hypothetical protein
MTIQFYSEKNPAKIESKVPFIRKDTQADGVGCGDTIF